MVTCKGYTRLAERHHTEGAEENRKDVGFEYGVNMDPITKGTLAQDRKEIHDGSHENYIPKVAYIAERLKHHSLRCLKTTKQNKNMGESVPPVAFWQKPSIKFWNIRLFAD